MEVVSVPPFGGGETMVHSCHRMRERKLERTLELSASFPPLSQICALREEVLTFRRNNKKLIDVA